MAFYYEDDDRRYARRPRRGGSVLTTLLVLIAAATLALALFLAWLRYEAAQARYAALIGQTYHV